jgi:hypothetical protein
LAASSAAAPCIELTMMAMNRLRTANDVIRMNGTK